MSAFRLSRPLSLPVLGRDAQQVAPGPARLVSERLGGLRAQSARDPRRLNRPDAAPGRFRVGRILNMQHALGPHVRARHGPGGTGQVEPVAPVSGIVPARHVPIRRRRDRQRSVHDVQIGRELALADQGAPDQVQAARGERVDNGTRSAHVGRRKRPPDDPRGRFNSSRRGRRRHGSRPGVLRDDRLHQRIGIGRFASFEALPGPPHRTISPATSSQRRRSISSTWPIRNVSSPSISKSLGLMALRYRIR